MAIGDPEFDPALAFGTPTPSAAPWSWVPEAWRTPSDLGGQLSPFEAQGVPEPVPAIAAPPEPVPAGLPAPGFDIPSSMPIAEVGPDPGSAGGPAALPPLPMPDVVTSADPGPLPPIEPEQLDTAPITLADQWTRDPLRSPDMDQRRLAAIELTNDPIRLAQMQADQAAARRAAEAAEQRRIEEHNLKQIENNATARREAQASAQRKSDQIAAEAMTLSQREIDPDRLMSKMSGGQTVAQGLAILFGGLVSGRTGGPNVAMEQFERKIDRDIAAQKADLANAWRGIDVRQGAVAQEYERSKDAYQAGEVVRLAIYQSAINLMKAKQQDFDPMGTQSLELAGHIRDLNARMAAAKEVQRKTIFDEDLRTRKQKLDEEQAAETARNNRAQNALRAQELAEQRKQREAAAQAKAEEKAAERADKEEERNRQFSVGTPRPALKLDDKGNPVIAPDGKPELITQRLVNKDGKPWRLGSNEENKEMKAKITAASEITDMIDEVLDIREKVGGEIMPWSDAKQRLALLQERMRLVRKSGTQGMSSDKDFEALGASIGAANLNSFIDQSPGLKEARERTISELNTQMRTANYTGPALSFENRYASATNTPEDNQRKGLLRDRGVSFEQALKGNIDKAVADRGYGLDMSDPADQALYRSIRDQTQASYTPGAAADQAQDIVTLGASAAGGDPDALAVLKEIASKGETGKLRELAKAQIEALKPAPPARGPQTAPVAVPDELRLP